MRPERHAQLEQAAAMAGRRIVADPRAQAEEIATRLMPTFARAIAEELEAVRSERLGEAETERAKACVAVGAALDALDQAKFVGGSEYRARLGLEQAVRKLKKVMDREAGRG